MFISHIGEQLLFDWAIMLCCDNTKYNASFTKHFSYWELLSRNHFLEHVYFQKGVKNRKNAINPPSHCTFMLQFVCTSLQEISFLNVEFWPCEHLILTDPTNCKRKKYFLHYKCTHSKLQTRAESLDEWHQRDEKAKEDETKIVNTLCSMTWKQTHPSINFLGKNKKGG